MHGLIPNHHTCSFSARASRFISSSLARLLWRSGRNIRAPCQMHTALTVTKHTPSRPCLRKPRGKQRKHFSSAIDDTQVVKQGKRDSENARTVLNLSTLDMRLLQEVLSIGPRLFLCQPGLGVVVRVHGRIHVMQLVAIKHPFGGVDVRAVE